MRNRSPQDLNFAPQGTDRGPLTTDRNPQAPDRNPAAAEVNLCEGNGDQALVYYDLNVKESGSPFSDRIPMGADRDEEQDSRPVVMAQLRARTIRTDPIAVTRH